MQIGDVLSVTVQEIVISGRSLRYECPQLAWALFVGRDYVKLRSNVNRRADIPYGWVVEGEVGITVDNLHIVSHWFYVPVLRQPSLGIGILHHPSPLNIKTFSSLRIDNPVVEHARRERRCRLGRLFLRECRLEPF